MSLTSLLSNRDVKEKFSQEFSKPPFNLRGELLASPKTNRYTLIGTAFDYLMRFYLKRLNPEAITDEWVAELAVKPVNDKKLLKKIKKIILQARVAYSNYIKTGKMEYELVKSSLLLAQIDPIFRAGVFDENLGRIDEKDVQDLKNLIYLVQPNLFKTKKICILNPTFGKGSELVGGADTDLLIDSTLIDIKTTKFLKLDRTHLNQIIGYYILYRIGGVDDAPKDLNIDTIGIYYSRHGLLFKIPVGNIIDEIKLPNFIKWFKKRAKEENPLSHFFNS